MIIVKIQFVIQKKFYAQQRAVHKVYLTFYMNTNMRRAQLSQRNIIRGPGVVICSGWIKNKNKLEMNFKPNKHEF